MRAMEESGEEGMNNDISMETRIALLEQEARVRLVMLQILTKSQEMQSDMIHEIDKNVNKLLLMNDATIGPRVTSLEMTRAESKGGIKLMMAIVGLSSSLGAFVAWIIGLIGRKA